MTTDSARVFTRTALGQLSSALDQAPDWDSFLVEVDLIAQDPGSTLSLPFDTSHPDQLITTRAGRLREGAAEASNAVAVFEYLGSMNRVLAADPRLWTYLAFVTFRDYMAQRWDPMTAQSWKNRVRDRWLIVASKRETLIRHGIARLWWVTSLTFDPKMSRPLSQAGQDPFAYTLRAFQKEDRLLQLFDRWITALPEAVFALLEAIESTPVLASERGVRELLIGITRENGIRELSALRDDQLREVVRTVAHSSAARLGAQATSPSE